ncbi:MAG: hypothetical protein RLZZ57_1460 [Pseudomonadota bacterium]|jgi:hypothetical protein
MALDLASTRQATPKEAPRLPAGSAGSDRAPGSVPPPASPEVGPANPRLRIDRDLGMVVIEFRDAAGRVAVSLPTPREIEAYKAAVVYGADLPSGVRPMNTDEDAPIAARPNIPLAAESEPTEAAQPTSEGVNRLA